MSGLIGFMLGVFIIVLIVAAIISVFNFGVYDFIVEGMNYLAELIGSGPAYICLGIFALGFSTIVVRFILSWIGENPGSSANH